MKKLCNFSRETKAVKRQKVLNYCTFTNFYCWLDPDFVIVANVIENQLNPNPHHPTSEPKDQLYNDKSVNLNGTSKSAYPEMQVDNLDNETNFNWRIGHVPASYACNAGLYELLHWRKGHKHENHSIREAMSECLEELVLKFLVE